MRRQPLAECLARHDRSDFLKKSEEKAAKELWAAFFFAAQIRPKKIDFLLHDAKNA
jgi:hypothetical protein